MRLSCLAAICLAWLATPALAGALRPAIAKKLQAAERALAKGQYQAALKDVAQAAEVPGQSSDETLTIDQVRAAVDAARKDYGAAAADYGAIIATGALAPDQVQLMAQAEASSAYQAGDYAGTIRTITAYLPDNARFRVLLLQSYLKTNDCGALQAEVGRLAKPAEAELQMVAYCDATAKDRDGYVRAMSALVADYPSPQYWGQLLALVQANPAFADRLALDLFRLKLAAGVPAAEPEYMDMTQAAVQAGLTNEAAKIMAQGFASGVLGSGPDADRQNRLKALVAQRQAAASAGAVQQTRQAAAADDQQSLFDIGFNAVDAGDASGLTLMANAIRSGRLTQPDPAELELGIGYFEAGQRASAEAMWHAVQGGGGAAELATLWSYLR